MEPCFKEKLITPTESYGTFVQLDQLETGKNKRLQKKLKKCLGKYQTLFTIFFDYQIIFKHPNNKNKAHTTNKNF